MQALNTLTQDKAKIYAWSITLVSTLLIAWLAFYASEIKMTANYAELFTADNEANRYREFHREVFGADDTLFIAIIEPEELHSDFFEQLDFATKELSSISDFIRVESVTNSAIIKSSDEAIIIEPVFDAADLKLNPLSKDDLLKLLSDMRRSPLLNNRYVSQTHTSFIILAELPAKYDSADTVMPLAKQFQSVIENAFSNTNTYTQYAGIAFTRMGLMELMQKDLSLLIPLCFSLIALALWILYRSWVPIVITGLLITSSITSTLACMQMLNIDLNQLTTIFPLIVMIVIVANAIHFFQHFYHVGQSTDHYQAIVNSFNTVSQATILSCLTTSIGFFSLMISEMPILREFGGVLGSSLLISGFYLFFLTPSLIFIFKGFINTQKFKPRFNSFHYRKENLRKWFMFSASIMLLASFFIPNTHFDFYLEDMLEKEHPQVLSANALNNQFSGSLPLEISLKGQPGDFKKPENLQRIQTLQDWLTSHGIHDSLSLSTIILRMNTLFAQNDIPDDQNLIAQYLLLVKTSNAELIDQLSNHDYSVSRIRAFMPDMGSQHYKKLEREFHTYALNLFSDSDIQVRLTGEMPLVYKGFDRLTHELLLSLLIATLCILFIIGLIYRKPYLMLASIFPNVLPIILGLALYSLFDDGLNPLPAIAFCIGIGISVDDTIHLFSRYQQAMKQGLPPSLAIEKAIEHCAPALILSSIILTLGFLLFLLSGFTWNQELGLLVSFMIICALWADLYLTPACIQFFHHENSEPVLDNK